MELYFKELGDTRNYYSHYKLDKSGVLEIGQILTSINVLKATIISILFSHMGMEQDLTRRILEFDEEVSFETKFLRKEYDRPFEHPSRVPAEQSSEKKPCCFRLLFKRIGRFLHG